MNRNKRTALKRWLQKAEAAGLLNAAEVTLIRHPKLSASKLRMIANEVGDRIVASKGGDNVAG